MATPRPHSLIRALEVVPTFASLDGDALLTVIGESINLFWERGATVFESGSPGDGLYVVLSGAVQIVDDAGNETTRLGRGQFFGEFSLLLGQPHNRTVVAAEDSELLVIPRESFQRLLGANEALATAVEQTIAERAAVNARDADAGS
jgi:CRP-like cAMP-binding protein